jgi:L,D-transpeptidase catalytic domain
MRFRCAKRTRQVMWGIPFVFLFSSFNPSSALAVPDPQSGGGANAAPAAVIAEKPPAPKPIVVTLSADVNLTTQQLTVSSGGKTLHVWPISSGVREFATPTGSFRPQWMAKMWFSKQYDDAPMPHSVFFNGGIATHATQSVGRLGNPASHGCIRLAPAAAATFYGLVQKHGLLATRIVVRGTPKFRDELAAKRQRPLDPSRSLEPQERTARYDRPYGYGSYANTRPSGNYGYAPVYRPSSGYYAQTPRTNEMRWPGDGLPQGQVRYIPRGYVRY